MEEKLQELQRKLADEESGRKGMETVMSQMTEKQLTEKDNLLKVFSLEIRVFLPERNLGGINTMHIGFCGLIPTNFVLGDGIA